MGWFSKEKAPLTPIEERKKQIPEGVWTKCKNCNEIIYTKEIERNLNVCPKCEYHFRISARERIELIIDAGTFVEMDPNLASVDVLQFKDSKNYADRIKAAVAKCGPADAVICGIGDIHGLGVALAVFDFSFLGGSMGSVVGEKITRAIEKGLAERRPVLIFSASGGARMQESIFSLMQMAKTSAALAKLKAAGIPFISILTDPTTGGVTASFAMLGDVNIAEPRALIGFAGPRVIEQTIRQTLPEGFQRSEYLLEHGMVDMIVPRAEMKDRLAQILHIFTKSENVDFCESREFLYGLQRFGIKLGLDNTRTLLERAGTPQQHFLCVHVAGTNGKGSTSAFLATILQEAGLRVGLYTSPHLQSFCERISVNGTAISEAKIAALTDRLRLMSAEIPLTFFEFTTVMALCAFAEEHVDIAILETGMGGRLDATNAVTANLSLITPISLDHQEHLGMTLTAIAAEKAGIIKEGVPVICSVQEDEVLAVIRLQAAACHAPFLCAGRDFSITVNNAVSFDYNDNEEHLLRSLHSGLAGAHQPHNAALAIAAALQLRQQGINIPEAAIYQGISRVFWPGRLEWWRKSDQILLDGAHNSAGAMVLAAYLATLDVPALHWLVGVKNDKNYHEILAAILPLTTRLYAVAPPAVNAIEPEELVAVARSANVPAQAFASVAEGLQAARATCPPGAIILVAGSLFLVGGVRELLNKEEERS